MRTYCLRMYATYYVSSARTLNRGARCACRAGSYGTGIVSVTDCLPSRLSRVRAPSPALLEKPLSSQCFTGRFTGSEQREAMGMTVFFLIKRRSTNTCLHFLGTTCLAFRILTKVVTHISIYDHLPLLVRKHLPSWEGNNLPPGFLLIGGWRLSAAILVLRKSTHAAGQTPLL